MKQRQESKVMKDENKNQKETTEGIENLLRKYHEEALALKEEFLKNNLIDCSGDDMIACAENLAIQRKARAIFYGYKAQERYDLLFKYLRQEGGLIYGRHDLDAFKKAGAKENELEKFYIEQEKKVWKKRLQEKLK